jgi:hypothetical protein
MFKPCLKKSFPPDLDIRRDNQKQDRFKHKARNQFDSRTVLQKERTARSRDHHAQP